jgi:HemY protein
MIWSLAKIIIFIVGVAALALGAGWLLESEGGVRIIVAGMEITLGPLQSVIALIVMVLVIWLGLLIACWKFLNGDDTALSRYFARNKAAKGFDALAEGMMALASGEGRVALAKAEKADRYLNRPELTNLLTAQAAELAGDRKKAEETYRKLVENDATRFVGVRGIMKQKLAEGDTETALKLAEKAFLLKPKHIETQDLLLKLQAGKQDWAGARQTLSAKLKYGSLPRDLHKRRDAVLALSEAKKILDDDQTIEAREAAIAANRQSPDLIPAAVMAAHGYIEQGQKKYATRVLKKAWEAQPHPDLAAAFAAIEPDETPAARLKRFAQLTRSHPTNPESRMLMSELNIAAEDFPEARRALGDLLETDPTIRSATLMAAIERGQGASDAVVQGWLTRALSAPRGPQWVCDNCQNIHAEWTPVCTNCAAFDTLAWKRPPSTELAMPGGTEMLPLLGAQTSTAVAVLDEPHADSDVIEAEDLGNPVKKGA